MLPREVYNVEGIGNWLNPTIRIADNDCILRFRHHLCSHMTRWSASHLAERLLIHSLHAPRIKLELPLLPTNTPTRFFRPSNQTMAPMRNKPRITRFHDKEFEAHMELLCLNGESEELDELSIAPVFMGQVGKHRLGLQRGCSNKANTLDQYGLLGRDLSANQAPDEDPRLFYNVAAPTSTFICGSQGSGKSHTLATLLENCLVQSKANLLPRPLAGLVFHYDTFISDTGGLPCETAYLSSHKDIKVRVLCPPTNVMNIKVSYL